MFFLNKTLWFLTRVKISEAKPKDYSCKEERAKYNAMNSLISMEPQLLKFEY